MSNGIAKLVAVIYLYLANVISGRELVSHVDTLVSSDQLLELPTECEKAFHNLHENLALCVWDDQTYSESPGIYIKEPEMRKLTEEFISSWGKLLSQHL